VYRACEFLTVIAEDARIGENGSTAQPIDTRFDNCTGAGRHRFEIGNVQIKRYRKTGLDMIEYLFRKQPALRQTHASIRQLAAAVIEARYFRTPPSSATPAISIEQARYLRLPDAEARWLARPANVHGS